MSKRAHAHVYESFARAHAWIFTKINLLVSNYLMNLSLDFRNVEVMNTGSFDRSHIEFDALMIPTIELESSIFCLLDVGN